MTIKQIEREQVLVEIIAERDGMIKNLVQENARQAEKIKALEAPLQPPAATKGKKTKEE